MTVNRRIDPARMLEELLLAQATPDLLRELHGAFTTALLPLTPVPACLTSRSRL